jgi:hypothetical protein
MKNASTKPSAALLGRALQNRITLTACSSWSIVLVFFERFQVCYVCNAEMESNMLVNNSINEETSNPIEFPPQSEA